MQTIVAGSEAVIAHQVFGLWQILLFPLAGALITYCLGASSKSAHRYAGWMASFSAAMSFAWVVRWFVSLRDLEALHSLNISYQETLWNWFTVGKFAVDFSLRFDHLSAVMCLFITGVGSLIHVYAIGYMEHDEHRPRFFSYLNLFLFSMLILALGGNLLVLFVGWEGVGLCSYLLIGFWFKEMDNAKAGQKAFVVNRIGDAGFVLGMFILITLAGSLEFDSVNALAEQVHGNYTLGMMIFAATLLLFVGATGKSAQIPLYVWLPDAMAGPTPVSALIHAATMVTSGIYLISRLSPLFVVSPVLLIIAVIGALTAFFAATIALVQNDIKKVLAYSTVSQLGYMFMALGVGAFSTAMFHVVTHAFFKACLFMGAGSVIIGCHHEQDMRAFGGLRKTMPLTFVTYLVSTLAIAGFPFLSGFYSKDMILWSVFSDSHPAMAAITIGGVALNKVLWGLGVVTALMTAFYMTRSLVMTFFGEYRGHHHPHESPLVVTIPLIVLATLSAVFGALFGEDLLQFLSGWTRSDLAMGHEHLAHQPYYHLLEYISIGAAVSGIAIATLFYGIAPTIPGKIAQAFRGLHQLLLDKWYIDELYQAVFLRPLRLLSEISFRLVDRLAIDGLVNGAGVLADSSGDLVSRLHVGRIGTYILAMLVSMLGMLVFWFVG